MSGVIGLHRFSGGSRAGGPECALPFPDGRAMSIFSRREQALGLAAWLLVVFVAAAAGAVASAQSQSFYGQLVRPDWAPPASVFGPVWTILYASMGIAAWLAWRERGFGGARNALSLFLVQLVLNALWSWLFFAWRLGGWALADIIVLWLLIVATLVAFWRIRPLAGALLVPYLAWVSFATFLNHAVWRLNPALLGS
jgi:benzodiazapine receptor